MTIENFSISQNETFTQKPWNELYKEAIQVVPFYLVGRIQVHPDSQEPSGADNPREHTYEWYDGTYLKLHLEDESISPLTRHKILDVKYFCFRSNELIDSKELSMKDVVDQLIPIDSFQFREPNPKSTKLLFESLNPYAAMKRPLKAGQIQFIVSSKLQEAQYQTLWNNYSNINMSKSTYT